MYFENDIFRIGYPLFFFGILCFVAELFESFYIERVKKKRLLLALNEWLFLKKNYQHHRIINVKANTRNRRMILV